MKLDERTQNALIELLTDDAVIETMSKFTRIVIAAACLRYNTDYPTNLQIIDTSAITGPEFIRKMVTRGRLDKIRGDLSKIIMESQAKRHYTKLDPDD